MWVLGSATTLERSEVWAALLKNAEERNTIMRDADAKYASCPLCHLLPVKSFSCAGVCYIWSWLQSFCVLVDAGGCSQIRGHFSSQSLFQWALLSLSSRAGRHGPQLRNQSRKTRKKSALQHRRAERLLLEAMCMLLTYSLQTYAASACSNSSRTAATFQVMTLFRGLLMASTWCSLEIPCSKQQCMRLPLAPISRRSCQVVAAQPLQIPDGSAAPLPHPPSSIQHLPGSCRVILITRRSRLSRSRQQCSLVAVALC